jgi:hypothetical protein
MEEIQLSSFRNDMYNIINSVISSHKPVLISDKGQLLVKIVSFSHSEEKSWLGCMKTTGKITGDMLLRQKR